MSKRTQDPRRLDVAAASSQALALSGQWPSSLLERVSEGSAAAADEPVAWAVRFELRPVPGSRPAPWLHLQATTSVTRECQRCLQPVTLPLAVDRWLRFVDDEATAAAQDADSDEDVLVSSRQFDLQALVEDELLLAMPLVPMHDVCPTPLAQAAEEVAAEAQAHPFAALAALKRGGNG